MRGECDDAEIVIAKIRKESKKATRNTEWSKKLTPEKRLKKLNKALCSDLYAMHYCFQDHSFKPTFCGV